VLQNVTSPKISVLDTMNFWISGKAESLENLLKKVDVMILNDEEIRQLTGIHHIIEAADALLGKGLKAIIVKKGEHGAMLVTEDDLRMWWIPQVPVIHLPVDF
jgi:sugar/nucleoside kinase (ribokinase family)